jgi:hypothetical protein
VNGDRPKVVPVTLDMIWGLRTNPNPGGDVFKFSLTPTQVASPQKTILRDWISNGANILLLGSDEISKYLDMLMSLIPSPGTRFTSVSDPVAFADHPVNTEVSQSRFLGSYGVTGYPEGTEVIVYRGKAALAGRIPFGRGNIYFANISTSGTYGDRDRWLLNFYHWMLGLPIPGALGTSVLPILLPPSPGGQPSSLSVTPQPQVTITPQVGTVSVPPVTVPAHQVRLKTGEIITGDVTTLRFLIETGYANLWFDIGSISRVVLAGAGTGMETIVLRSGDVLNGTVWPETVQVRLATGWVQEFSKEDISEIVSLW